MIKDQRMDRTHRQLSASFAAFMDHVCAQPEAVAPFDRSHLPKLSFPFPMNAWPYFADAQYERTLADATEAVIQLLSLVPERIFKGDGAALSAFYGYASPAFAEAVFAPPHRMETVLARPDFLLTADGPKCLETNVATNIGGTLTQPWVTAYLERPLLAEFLERQKLKLRFVDPLYHFCEHLVSLAERMELYDGDDRLQVGVLLSDDHTHKDMTITYFQGLIDQHLRVTGRSREVRFLLIEQEDDLVIGPEILQLYGQRIGILLQAGGKGTSMELLQLYKRGGVHLFNGPAHLLMSNKRSLALLSMHAASPAFSPEERRLIERYIPWTHTIAAGSVSYRGEREDLETLLLRKPEWFVLKRGFGYSGQHVIVGCRTEPAQWRTMVAHALAEGDWLVQEYLVSEPVLGMAEDGVMAVHELVLGLFCFGGRFGGTFLRGGPYNQGSGVINSSNGAVESLLLFHD